ncbi:MAG: FAD-binding oxidoreductase [Lutibacter sp.]|jgi:ring-1,2-phenylacetyl-CoA epoxidase subunit PaaE
MAIKKLSGTITKITDLTETSKEVEISLPENLDFIPGAFVNFFMDIGGEKVRRAYSISSSNSEQNKITVSIRLSPNGKMTPLFWQNDLTDTQVELMGPLGLNTADKMRSAKIYLFGFGIGAGVVKSLADYFVNKKDVEKVTIITGSRFENEIIYKDYFDNLAKAGGAGSAGGPEKVSVDYIISRPAENSPFKKGYIQNHLENFDFNNSDVYVCGQESACNELIEKVKASNPTDCQFFIEGFH